MKSYIMLIIAAALLSANFVFNKLYQNRRGASLQSGLLFNVLIGGFSAVLFFVLNGCKLHFSAYSLLMTSMVSILGICYYILGFRIMKFGTMTLYTLFLMIGGMTIPYVFGVLFLDEDFSILRTMGIFLLILAVVLPNISRQRMSAKLIVLCVLVFCLNGLVSIVSKIHQITPAQFCVNEKEFVILGGIVKAILAGGLYLQGKNKQTEEVVGDKFIKNRGSIGILIVTFGAAAVSGLSYILQLQGARELPATVLYPFITGGSVIFTAIADRIVFHMKLSKRMLASIALCFVGTLMFL